MRLLLIGAPGSGKGTQGARIAERYDVEHIAAGDLLRAEVAAGTALGRSIADTMRAGRLVPDDVVSELVFPRLLAAAEHRGYVLDGFPRSVAQAEQARHIAVDESGVRRAVQLDVPRDQLLNRLVRRAASHGRADDTPATIAERLDVFDRVTAPLLDFYRAEGLLHVVDGSRPKDEVTGQIVAALPPLIRARTVSAPWSSCGSSSC